MQGEPVDLDIGKVAQEFERCLCEYIIDEMNMPIQYMLCFWIIAVVFSVGNFVSYAADDAVENTALFQLCLRPIISHAGSIWTAYLFFGGGCSGICKDSLENLVRTCCQDVGRLEGSANSTVQASNQTRRRSPQNNRSNPVPRPNQTPQRAPCPELIRGFFGLAFGFAEYIRGVSFHRPRGTSHRRRPSLETFPLTQ